MMKLVRKKIPTIKKERRYKMYIVILGSVMACLTVWFWYVELSPLLKAISNLKVPESKNPIKVTYQSLKYIVSFLRCTLLSLAFLLDLGCTYLLTAVFFGTGGLGVGVIGLTASNFVSLIIIYKIGHKC